MAVLISGSYPLPKYLSPTFSNNTWEQIIEACQSGRVPAAWAVSDQKEMNINGTNYLIDIIGKGHDTYSDGTGTAPLTFQLHDCYEEMYSMTAQGMTNSGSWADTTMRTVHLPAVLELMPNEVKRSIREVNKFTSSSGSNGTIRTSADKLFLLSEIEVLGHSNSSYSGEGSQYKYYADGGSTSKTKNGSATNWWSRSPLKGDAMSYRTFPYSGGSSSNATTNGLSFAFCF